jgi:imidazolonepropionase-like amidohydrolase
MKRTLAPPAFIIRAVALTILTAAPLLAGQSARTVAIRCGLLIDGRSDGAVSNATIIIRDGRIEAVGRNTPIPSGAQVIDLGSATCLPGLMDLHVHLLTNTSMGFETQYFNRSGGRKALDGLRNAQRMLQCGFTTLRIPGDDDLYYADIDVRDAIARGEFVGPRLLVAPHMLTATGGHGDYNDLAPDVLVRAANPVISGAESAREIVRQEIKYGADWIKIAITGGVISVHDDPRVTSFTDEELRAAVEETHRYRKKVCVHAIGTEGVKQALRVGVDSIEHAVLIDQEGIRMMKERGIYLVPTLYVLNHIVEDGEKLGYDPGSVAKGKTLVEERNRNIRAAFAAGVKVAFGSDTIFPVEQATREFACLVQLGLTPMQAIRAATLNAADLLGLAGEIGSIEVGKKADIIAVGENPLKNIRSLENVRFVMKDGSIVKNQF